MNQAAVAALLADAPAPLAAAGDAVVARAGRVLRPADAFERLDAVAAWLAGWQGTDRPSVRRPALLVFVSDHGVAREGVSAYPARATAAMYAALEGGAATATVMADEVGASVDVVDVGVGRPTGNIVREPAMDVARFESSFDAGRRALRSTNSDLLVVGEMGIGNTTSAAAIACRLFGRAPEDWTGRGTGIDDATMDRKVEAVRTACARISTDDPIEILRELGGAEMVAIVGAVIEARLHGLPVILDGFVTTAAVAVLEAAVPGALDHCIAGHRSPEPGHSLLLEKLGKEPLLDLGLRLGEGSGALAAIPLVRLAVRAVTDVATFEEWGLQG
ncbi:MAG: nicotinate-nucleotide--dimethylbenzimidazole phosphoribosyltransferase [Actinobacteria bacterium]|nr:nicotinate-nucleotide--dimethylbenzimidazole phosphoribosyltransferase [Actinomycetota bacterium]